MCYYAFSLSGSAVSLGLMKFCFSFVSKNQFNFIRFHFVVAMACDHFSIF